MMNEIDLVEELDDKKAINFKNVERIEIKRCRN